MGEILQEVGPKNPDEAGELVAKLGVYNRAEDLIAANAAARPQEITSAQMRPEHEGRTRYLDPDEVDAELKSFLKDDEYPDHDEITVIPDACRVRGANDRPEEMAVVCLFEVPESGRTSRAVINYDRLSKSQKAYDRALRAGEVVEGGPDEDPEALKATISSLRSELARTKADSGGGVDPEAAQAAAATRAPDGAAIVDGNAGDVTKRVADLSPAELDAAEKAETDGKKRKTVLAAIKDARESG